MPVIQSSATVPIASPTCSALLPGTLSPITQPIATTPYCSATGSLARSRWEDDKNLQSGFLSTSTENERLATQNQLWGSSGWQVRDQPFRKKPERRSEDSLPVSPSDQCRMPLHPARRASWEHPASVTTDVVPDGSHGWHPLGYGGDLKGLPSSSQP